MRRFLSKVQRRLFRPSETLDGYEEPELVDIIFRKTLAYEPQGEWPEMRGVSSVLDFGGGCGLHYKQANSGTVRWAVVETAAMVDRAKEIATDRLRFFTSISEAKDWLGDVDVMHSDGAIQYTADPLPVVRELCGIGATRMLWQRVLFSDKQKTATQASYLGDNGPGSIQIAEKMVRYTRTAIPETTFLAAHDHYNLENRGKVWLHFTARVGFC